MIKLPFRISIDNLKETYHNVREALNGNDNIIFDAMVSITAGKRNPFTPPTSPTDFNHKHQELEDRLVRPVFGTGLQIAMSLMEEIVAKARPSGGIGRYSVTDLFEIMKFQTGTPKTNIFLTKDFNWAVSWDIDIHMATTETPRKVILDIYNNNIGEIVPLYLVRYVQCAVLAYQERVYSGASALLSMTVEATLREVLAKKGYNFDRGASSVDIYQFIKADVGVSGNMYTLTFQQPMPLSPTDFLSAYGSNSVEIQIRRNINPNNNRIDLLVKSPDLIDHWSTTTIAQKAVKRVNGLGEALKIARYVEGFLDTDTLPEDFDEVIKAIRNNLIHLSGDALNTRLPMFDGRSRSGNFTLQDFLEDPELMYDFIISVPLFISEQYNKLCRITS